MDDQTIDQLLEILKKSSLFSVEEYESIIHALIDIHESIDEVYNKIIPKILNVKNIKRQDLKDFLWNIGEEFRHIDYHIKDSKITEL